MNLNKNLLILGGILIVLGLYSKVATNFNPKSDNSNIDVMELSEPSDPTVKQEATDVLALLKNSNGSKNDFKKLRDLSLDLARLIELDGEDMVIKSTEEIRQANSLAGVMLRLDVKGKYKDLAKESKDVIVAAVGDDNVSLSTELRTKAVDGFGALAWAYNEASK